MCCHSFPLGDAFAESQSPLFVLAWQAGAFFSLHSPSSLKECKLSAAWAHPHAAKQLVVLKCSRVLVRRIKSKTCNDLLSEISGHSVFFVEPNHMDAPQKKGASCCVDKLKLCFGSRHCSQMRKHAPKHQGNGLMVSLIMLHVQACPCKHSPKQEGDGLTHGLTHSSCCTCSCARGTKDCTHEPPLFPNVQARPITPG
eukprot:1157351-Pelagomonas_calceolata.AAC.9